MYWIADVSVHVKELRTLFYQRGSGARGVVFTSLLALLAAVLQSMGNFFPGIGYVLSALSTMPIVLLCCMLSIRYGCLGYLAAFFLLLIIQRGEAFVFPFTTGLLGIGLGSAFQSFSHSQNNKSER
ncbi:hypothetical protein [Aneurinibacillus tyrosinisolvens]|uniref:hypothetical protein n=1 Tax=Aneurinibacillus tyrosinisolvens TaxID=1443435 RepID=UPI00069C9AF3|nr:hypothetical protein [Aneurinibacillus tyrosinisolvens]